MTGDRPTCAVCGRANLREKPGGNPQRYCSHACRSKAWRERHRPTHRILRGRLVAR